MIKRELNAMANAFAYFSRIPVPKWVTFGADSQRHASRYFPLVGWLIASILALLWWGSAQLWGGWVPVLLVMAGSIYLTGAFHEDGFADCCDGFGGGYGKAQILTIMKDSRLGTYGVLGSIVLMLLKVSLLVQLCWPVLLIAYPWSRVMPVWMMYWMSYARQGDSSGKAGSVSQGLSHWDLAIATLLGAAGLGFLGVIHPPLWLIGLVVILPIGICLCFSRYIKHHIGGFSGDCLGAAQQLAEVSIYLVLGASWHSFG